MVEGRFEGLLNECERIHGHLCPGQVLGVRMAMYGLGLIGIRDPHGADRKKVCLFVEIDRCATDALQSVTGCSLGRRTMRFIDYGKLAATFVNLRTGQAVRLVAREEARERARECYPGIADAHAAQIEAYRRLPDAELFTARDVAVELRPQDMPGRPLRKVRCERCGEFVQDMRDVTCQGRTLCQPCAAGGGYYCRAEGTADARR
jgi:formylmethanofuran dehydrogenase subunit E